MSSEYFGRRNMWVILGSACVSVCSLAYSMKLLKKKDGMGFSKPSGVITSPEFEYILAKAGTICREAGASTLTEDHIVAALNSLHPGGSKLGKGMPGTAPTEHAPPAEQMLTKHELEETMRSMLGGPQPGDMDNALERFTKDLTLAARMSKLDPVIGRENEMRRVIHILSRRTKNNPVLLGESGVGKTALVEGLAQRIVARDVPTLLLDTKILELDLGSLTAGCMMPGEFEERLKGVLKEVSDARGRIILFIDDIHNLVPNMSGQGAGGMLDGGSLLKPALSRGELRCIGATTADKYKKTVERDAALERRFQQVMLEQPSVADTVSILRGLRQRYETYHHVEISESAIIAATILSDRYINGRFLPDKAIDLMDEATAQVHMEVTAKPEALDSLERRVRQLEEEAKSLKRKAQHDRQAASSLAEVEALLGTAMASKDALTETFMSDKKATAELAEMREEIRRTQLEAKRAGLSKHVDQHDVLVLKAAELREKYRETMAATSTAGVTRLSRPEVMEADIAKVISRWTGIPVTKLVASEKERLLGLTEELHKRIIGQEEAVSAVAEAIQRARADLSDPNGPIASFMFLGPTGVGKTELAKALAAYLFNSEEAMVRLDMSEYMEKHAVSRLIGAPPGYVGYEEGGLLTDAVRRRPYAVVLFDEIEKAHVDVFNVLLQILDDGRVTDTQGRTVSFKNTLIIMTSNLGSAEIFTDVPEECESGGAGREQLRLKVMEHVRGHFRPEFINRVDEFIIFDPLHHDQIRQIVVLRAQKLVERLAQKRLKLELTEEAVSYLAVKGYDPVYGARPVKRALQRELQTLLAKALLRGEFEEDDTIRVDVSATANGVSSAAIKLVPQALKFTRIAADPKPALPLLPAELGSESMEDMFLQGGMLQALGLGRGNGNGNGFTRPCMDWEVDANDRWGGTIDMSAEADDDE